MNKNQEQQEQKEQRDRTVESVKNKRKTLYIVLAAVCAVALITAVTLTAVFVPRGNGVSIEKPLPDDKPDTPPTPDKPSEPNTPDVPGDTEMVFLLPVSNASVGTAFTFWHNQTLNRYQLHTGIDFKADAGTQVVAAYAGKVESVTDTLLEGGKVVIDHGNGLKTTYASIGAVSGLKAGDSVSKGQKIGTVSAAADVMGNEFKEGTHLHFEVTENGKSVDPASYLETDEK